MKLAHLYYDRAKGHYASFVARGDRNPQIIAKTVCSELGKGGAFETDLARLLLEVESESVEVGGHSHLLSRQAPGRRQRFEKVKALILDD